jgi:hypothetical protein
MEVRAMENAAKHASTRSVCALLLLSAGGLTLAMGPTPRSAAQNAAQASATASAQTQPNQAGASAALDASASSGLPAGTTVNAELTSSIDAKKAKPGDTVSARATEAVKIAGRVIVPKGAKLVGHVQRASARAKGDAESALAIVFDRAYLKHGEELALNMTIQAMAAPRASLSSPDMDMEANGAASGAVTQTSMGSPRGALGGVASTAGAAAGGVANTAGRAAEETLDSATRSTVGAATSSGAAGGLNAAGELTSSSRGVFGLNGLALSSATSGSAGAGVITSAGKNIHLDGGTRLLLASQTNAAASPK